MKKRIFDSTEQANRRVVFRLMYEIGLIANEDTTAQKMLKINSWIATKTSIKEKGLNELDIKELTILINQLRAVKRRYLEQETNQANLN